MSKKILQPECQHCDARFKSVFCDLNENDLIKLNTSKGCNNFKKGQVIFNENGFPHGLFCVNSGKIKIIQTGEEGKEQILRFAKEGDILGYRALLSGDKYSCSAVAIDDASICFIPKQLFFTFIENDGTLSMKLMRLLSSDLKSAENKITDIAQKPVRERMAEALLFLKETYGYEADKATINVVLSREETANMVGTVRETATRLLSKFKDDGIIELVGKKIKILNLSKLLKTANIFD